MNPIDLHRWIAPLGWALVHFAWQGVAVALVAWASMTLSRAARVRYAIGCVAMAAMLALPIATLAWIGPDARVAESPIDPALRLSGKPARGSSSVWPETPRAGSSAQRIEFTLRERIGSATPAVVATWIVGVAILAGWHLVGLAQLARLRRRATMAIDPIWLGRVRELSARLNVRRRVALLFTDRLDCPAVVGAIRPAILWPLAAMSGLTPTQVEALLAHELAHVRRHDYAVNLLQTLVETLLFYHPAVWWLSRRVRQEREHCCDDLAASVVGDRATYAGALAAMESLRRSPTFAISARGGSLVRRVRRLLAPTPVRRLSPVGLGLIVTTLVLAGVFACKPRDPVPAGTAATVPTTQAFDDRIAAGDLLRVSIGELEGVGKTSQIFKRVAADGTITLPYFKFPFQLRGMTIAQAERRISDAYGTAQLIMNANVGVLVVQSADGRSIPPGLFAMTDAADLAKERPSGEAAPQRSADAIRPGDLLRVTVFEITGRDVESSLFKRVEPDGTITMPYLDKPVIVNGERPSAVERELSVRYRDANILPYAVVSVLIVQDADGHTLVPAELLNPSPGSHDTLASGDDARFASIKSELELLKASTRPAGNGETPRLTVQQLESLLNERQTIVIDLDRADPPLAATEELALRGMLSQLDQQLAQATGLVGDYYISGAVARPGVYSVNGRKVTLMQALTAAGCAAPAVPDDEPSHDFGIDVVRRDVATGQETRTRYPWHDVTHGKLATFYLLPNDQVIVGVGGATTTTAPTTQN